MKRKLKEQSSQQKKIDLKIKTTARDKEGTT